MYLTINNMPKLTTFQTFSNEIDLKPARLCFVKKPDTMDSKMISADQDTDKKIAELAVSCDIPPRFLTALNGIKAQKKLVAILASDDCGRFLESLKKDGILPGEDISDKDLRRILSQTVNSFAQEDKTGKPARYEENYDDYDIEEEIDVQREEYEAVFSNPEEHDYDDHSDLLKSLNLFLDEHDNAPEEDEIEEFLISLGYVHYDDNQIPVGNIIDIDMETKKELTKKHAEYREAVRIIKQAIIKRTQTN
jgi:hypothetical protein